MHQPSGRSLLRYGDELDWSSPSSIGYVAVLAALFGLGLWALRAGGRSEPAAPYDQNPQRWPGESDAGGAPGLRSEPAAPYEPDPQRWPGESDASRSVRDARGDEHVAD